MKAISAKITLLVCVFIRLSKGSTYPCLKKYFSLELDALEVISQIADSDKMATVDNNHYNCLEIGIPGEFQDPVPFLVLGFDNVEVGKGGSYRYTKEKFLILEITCPHLGSTAREQMEQRGWKCIEQAPRY